MATKAFEGEAIVLRVTRYSESDLILGLLSQDHGKISCFAPRSKNSRKRFGGALDLFGLLNIETAPPRNAQQNLWRLQGAQAINMHLGLRKNYMAMTTASYLSECLWKFLPEEHVHADTFAWWKETLSDLDQSKAHSASNLLYLDWQMLKHCGYQPRIQSCIDCETVGRRLFFSFERGATVCAACKTPGIGVWLDEKEMKESVMGKNSCKLLHNFVSYLLGGPPKSQAMRWDAFYGYQ